MTKADYSFHFSKIVPEKCKIFFITKHYKKNFVAVWASYRFNLPFNLLIVFIVLGIIVFLRAIKGLKP